MQDIGFDVIGDLNLSVNDSFNWENKATSLYCIVAGNISTNLRVVRQTLLHLGQFYQGVFYVPGQLEFQTGISIPERLYEILTLVKNIPNVCLLNRHVATIDGVAITGINGYSNAGNPMMDDVLTVFAREQEIEYLKYSIHKLQRHLDIKKIIVVTSAVPHDDLYFKEKPIISDDQTPLVTALSTDTEKKVTHWVFGSYDKIVDTEIENIRYVNNPRVSSIYYAKRLTISV